MTTKVCATVALAVVVLGVLDAATTPRKESTTDWWKTAVFYQIYPRSFMDTNGDGEGDLKGIESKLDYLKSLGVTATWLSPIFKSPMVDSGYDISNFREIDTKFGTMEDFENLLKAAHEKGIKIILDFVPNHSSDQHEWFKKSVAKEEGFEDYYVWKDSKDVPNAWESIFGGSAWEYNKDRKEWYLHQFATQQPDLNYRSPALVNEMKETLRFWLDKGVDGFRCDAVPFLFEDENFAEDDEIHSKTQNLPQTFDMIAEFRTVLDEYDGRVMMTEAYADMKNTMKYYGSQIKPGAHFTFNFLMITDLSQASNAHDFAAVLNKWFAYMPEEYTANWVIGNHDQHRVASRHGTDRVDGLAMLDLLLPGVGVTYNGEEIGMIDGEVSWKETQDPQALNAGEENYMKVTRDPERTPFQWSGEKNAGFSTGKKMWLPVSKDYENTNVAAQEKDSHSHLSLYKSLVALRKEPAFQSGEADIKAVSDDVLVMVRMLPNEESYVVVINLGKDEQDVSLEHFLMIPNTAEVVLTSTKATGHKIGDKLAFKKVTLGPYEAYVLKTAKPDAGKDDCEKGNDDDDDNGAGSTYASVFLLITSILAAILS